MKYNKVNILWNGITGRTGKSALENSKDSDFATIVAGISRSNNDYYNYNQLNDIKEDFDVIVDFSHADSFDKILELALNRRKPLIIGTANLSDRQLKNIEKASKIIPIYKGGNFIFDVKYFIDDVVSYAKETKEDIKLVETHYKTKKIPSQTAMEIKNRVKNETGKELIIESNLEYDDLINDYKVGNLHLRVKWLDNIAKDIFRIASLMNDNLEPGIYGLNELLNTSKKVIPNPPVGTATQITSNSINYIDSEIKANIFK